MRVGLTYDLKERYLLEGKKPEDVAECDSEQTIDAIDHALCSLGYETVRIGNITDLVVFLAQGRRCDIMFNIAEGLYGLCREAQIPALLDAYRIPYVFSDSFVLSIALHKGMAKSIVRDHGIRTADYCVVSEEDAIEQVDMPFPLFVKPIAGGTGMGINGDSVVRSRNELRSVASSLLSRSSLPVLIESYLDGREFTVGITGTGKQAACIATMEIFVDPHFDNGLYSYKSKQTYKETVTYRLADEKASKRCEKVALDSWRALGCRDGGRVDLRMDAKENVYFLEVNPLAGLNPIDSDLPMLAAMAGVHYDQLIGRIMDSALERLQKEKG